MPQRQILSSLLGSTVDTNIPPVYGGPGTRILRSILVLLFVPVYSALLGSTVNTNFASVYGEFHVFLRELVDYGS